MTDISIPTPMLGSTSASYAEGSIRRPDRWDSSTGFR